MIYAYLLDSNRKEKSLSDTQTHSHTALLVMDMQVGIVKRFAQTGDLLTLTSTAITAARAASIPVIYVVVAFRPGYPEISPRNKSFSVIKQQQSSSSAPMMTPRFILLSPRCQRILLSRNVVSARLVEVI